VLSKNRYKHISIYSSRFPLELRSPTPSDAPALSRILSDKRNSESDRSLDNLDQDSINKLVDQWTSFPESDRLERAQYLVFVENKPCGFGGVSHITVGSNKRKVADVGIVLDFEVRGKGYAQEALKMIIDHALRVLNLDEILITTTKANAPMWGLMDKKFGYIATRREGLFRHGNDTQWSIKKENWLSQP
jgi:RimJ/RimL family protein N-acetyltransferase